MVAGGHVDPGGGAFHRFPGPAGKVGCTRHDLRDRIEPRAVSVRPDTAEGGYVGEYNVRLDALYRLVVDAEVDQGFAGHVGHQDVGTLHQLVKDFPAFPAGHVEAETLLVAIALQKTHAGGIVRIEGQGGPVFSPTDVLDVDHFGAEVSQLGGTDRTGHVTGNIDNAEVIQDLNHYYGIRTGCSGLGIYYSMRYIGAVVNLPGPGMTIVDFHAHIVPDRYPARPAGVREPAWPEMVPVDDSLSSMTIDGREFRKFRSYYWDVDERIERMDGNGIDAEVLSPLPELLSYWLDADAAVALTDYMNEFVGGMVEKAPGRFQGLGCVALQDPAQAVRQLERLKAGLGLKGVHLGSHVNGRSLADERFYPFFEAAEDLGLVLLVHGIKPGGLDRLLGSPLMGPILGVPHETTAVIGSLIMTDILGRFPELKFIFSHGGGGIGAVLDRFDMVWNKFDIMRVNGDVSPLEYARRFYYDTVTFSPDYLGYLVKRLGADRFVAGTDGPAETGQKDLPGFLARAGLSEGESALITRENAARILSPWPELPEGPSS